MCTAFEDEPQPPRRVLNLAPVEPEYMDEALAEIRALHARVQGA